MKLDTHPSVIAYRQKQRDERSEAMTRQQLKALALGAGADDVGVVGIDCPDLEDQKEAIISAFPNAKTLVSLIIRMNPPQVQSSDRSLIDGEFIAVEEQAIAVSRKLVRQLRRFGISCITPPEGFPQDMSKAPGQRFSVSHKPVAQAAGLGKIGHHRLLIHPEFGSHLCLGTLIMDTALDAYDQPLDYNPCIDCNLCVATCPTGAIAPDGAFDFFKCLVHAYRDRIGGFLNWVEAMVTSHDMAEYREKRSDDETLAVWQSLTYGGGFRCGYCMSVCPAGTDLIGSYLDRRKDYLREVVKPLQNRKENVYVLPGQDLVEAVSRRFPNKKARPAVLKAGDAGELSKSKR
ncbi:MAG: 4Fe-4S binding protein [Desulfobacterium sp.]